MSTRDGAPSSDLTDASDLLRAVRLIYVAPTAGTSGVGDYAVDFAAEVAPHVKELIDFRFQVVPRPTVGTVLTEVRRIRAMAAECLRDGPVIVHFEQSGAALTPFWGALFAGGVPVTATVHDPPQPVWWPFDSAVISGHRLLHHGVHYPIRFFSNALQRRMSSGRTLMALSTVGARETQRRLPDADVRASRIFVPTRTPQPAVTQRPLAVGLYGHHYKGKGFDKIRELRDHLDDDIEIVVAGRGTESISARRGVTVLGEVVDGDEDTFFRSIRFLIAPYAKNNRYGPVFAASSAVARAFAYGTPVVCNMEGALAELVSEGGALGVDGDVAQLGRRVNTAIRDEDVLSELASEVAHLQAVRTVQACATPLLQAWSELVVGWAR